MTHPTGRYDIAVVGSGFAGSLFAMIARRLGRTVILVDKGRHPRFAIGESSTPLTNLLLEELSRRYDLPCLTPLCKWGTWQREYPGVACGLKRGFTFYHHDLDRPRTGPPERKDQLLVAASPNDEIGDTHWYRADFDLFFLQQAIALGVEFLDATALASATALEAGWELRGEREGREVSVHADFVVDASGPRGFLHRALGLKESALPNYPETEAIYTHFTGVKRLGDLAFGSSREEPPYPIDDAAVHHVFDGGWVWVLRFNQGVTSAGVAATREAALRLDFSQPGAAWASLLRQIPALDEQFAKSDAIRPFTHLPKLSFRSATIAGSNWAMLPSAAGFVDPLLSTGFPLTLLGVSRLARLIEDDWSSERMQSGLYDYAAKTDAELLATARLISALYANMSNFPVFSALTLLYFAAASFSETARRLGKHHLASSFLLHDHESFGPAAAPLLARAQHRLDEDESRALAASILATIGPFNVAGFGEPARRNWYPVDARDLFQSAAKLGATESEIAALLQRCGFPLAHASS